MKRSKKPQILLFLSAYALSFAAHCCEFHGANGRGFGMRFGHVPSSPSAELGQRPIELSTPPLVKAVKNQPTQLPIRYNSSVQGQNPSVQLSIAIDSTELKSDARSVVLQGEIGEHTFEILPKSAGTYRLVVTAKVLNQLNAMATHSVIYLKVV